MTVKFLITSAMVDALTKQLGAAQEMLMGALTPDEMNVATERVRALLDIWRTCAHFGVAESHPKEQAA